METVKEKLRKVIKKIFVEEDIRLYCRKQEEKNEEGGYLCDDCPYCEKSGCMETLLADRLTQNGVTIQEWVSVDERLPEKQHDWVLTACKLVPEGYYGVSHIAELRNGKWWADSGDFPLIEIGVEVTHWMPLPAPPKGVQE